MRIMDKSKGGEGLEITLFGPTADLFPQVRHMGIDIIRFHRLKV
jgi:hypothetical protein